MRLEVVEVGRHDTRGILWDLRRMWTFRDTHMSW